MLWEWLGWHWQCRQCWQCHCGREGGWTGGWLHAGALAVGMCVASTHDGGNVRRARNSSQGNVEVTRHWDKLRASDVRTRQGSVLPDEMRLDEQEVGGASEKDWSS